MQQEYISSEPNLIYDEENDVLQIVFKKTRSPGRDVDGCLVLFRGGSALEAACIYDFKYLLDNSPEIIKQYEVIIGISLGEHALGESDK